MTNGDGIPWLAGERRFAGQYRVAGQEEKWESVRMHTTPCDQRRLLPEMGTFGVLTENQKSKVLCLKSVATSKTKP